MAALQTLIPTPLVGKDFLKSTHMQLGLDFRQWGDTMKSTFKSHFLPVTATRLPLSQQPKPAQVEHKDLLQTKEFQSETCNAFSLKQLDPIERVPAWSRLTTNFRMHGDPRSDTFITIHSSHFKPRLAGHIPSRTTVAYQKGGGYMGPVCGDREEFTLPLTEQSAYEGHDVRLHPTVRAPCKHLGEDAAIRGEKGRGTSYHTHNRAVFEGRRHPPPQPVEKSIKSFSVELEGPEDAVFTSGEMVYGKVVLDLGREIKVRSLKVAGSGVAIVHWIQNRSVGMNIVYNDYSSSQTYFRKRYRLIRGRGNCQEFILKQVPCQTREGN
ncbi:UNVERIFIED_CONTAM: hypothetical protein FKN15_008674 [Acipenser sinensis]